MKTPVNTIVVLKDFQAIEIEGDNKNLCIFVLVL